MGESPGPSTRRLISARTVDILRDEGGRWAHQSTVNDALDSVEQQVTGAQAPKTAAATGVSEQSNSMVLVTVGFDGRLLDRRRIELTGPGLPTHPHHHEGSWAMGRYLNTPGARRVSLEEAVALVERVRTAAVRGAREGLAALAAAVPVPIASIAIRACPALPPTTEERIADSRAQTFADSVMYRQTLAEAAEARGWLVEYYDRDRIFRDAEAALGSKDIDGLLQAMGRHIGPPWRATHKLAAAAALAATKRDVLRPTEA
jgi:hypothetical protein